MFVIRSIIIILILNNYTTAETIYSAISSKLISSNSFYNVTIFVENGEKSPLTFSATINGQTDPILQSQAPVTIQPGESGTLSVQTGDLREPKYNLTLKIKGDGHEDWENKTTIFTSKKDRSLLMHTDKPLYKPGETVRFRVVLLDRELKPFKDDQGIEVKILDAERNIIKIWENAQVHQGLFKSELELSPEPVLGDWTLEVKVEPGRKQKGQQGAGGQVEGSGSGEEDDDDGQQRQTTLAAPSLVAADNGDGAVNNKIVSVDGEFYEPHVEEEDSDGLVLTKQLTFSVEKYVLPKFKVILTPPPFLTYNMTIAPVQIEAKYTYGKGVTGEYIIRRKRDYYWGSQKQKEVSVTGPIGGSGLAMVDVDIKDLFNADESQYDREVVFDVTVTENITGLVQNATSKVKIHKYPYKIDSIQHTSYVKPGLPFIVGFKVSTQDNLPIVDPSPTALKITHGFSYQKEGSTMTSPIPANGSITLTFDTPTNELIRAERIEIEYKELTHRYYIPQNYNSKLKTYLSVQILNGKDNDGPGQSVIEINSDLMVNVNATDPFSSINYIIQGRKEVIASGKIELKTPQKEHNFQVNCPEKGAPEAKLIVYLILSETKEVIADSVKFSVTTSTLNNYLGISLSSGTMEPGQNLTLKINASHPNSLIALRGVDQSILLLNKPDNDINQEGIDREIQDRNDEAANSHRIWGGSNAFQIFEQAGLIIQTNAQIEVEMRSPWLSTVRPQIAFAQASALQDDGMQESFNKVLASPGFAGGAGLRRKSGPRGEVRVRKNFPETWIWEEVALNGSQSVVDLIKTVPDTLTSWLITGYSLNSEFGIAALGQPQKLTVFRPFFVTLNLPYSVIKGEVLALQVLVHNYLPASPSSASAEQEDKTISAEITLDNAQNEFKFADETLKGHKSSTRTVKLEPNSVTSVTFIIVPQKFGSIMLNVKAFTDLATDGVSRPLRVKPPGEEQRRSVAALLRIESKGKGGATANLTADFPQKRVEGADNVKMTLISDILGSSIEHLDKLLQIPTGCGEQNMLNFVADIVILNYLRSSHSLTPKIKSKAVNFLETGYQRQLTYRHADASYSAFGSSDPSGSTWLTAFVARSFIQAKPYITIDDTVIERALAFLSSQQDEDSGSFVEPGKVLHSDMQGGSASNGVALTAYTLVTFVEAAEHWNKKTAAATTPEQIDQGKLNEFNGNHLRKNYTNVINKAVKYIVKKASTGRLNDNYALILTTYALHLANHADKNKYFDIVERLTIKEGGLSHWENREKEPSTVNKTLIIDHRPWELKTKSVSVEMTSYVLLIQLMRGRVAESTPIVRWLLKQRNANGGFVSTQDTVVGLTALAKFAALTKEGIKTDLTVKTINNNEGDKGRQIKINEATAVQLQEFILPPTTRWVQFDASGSGTALAQLSWSFYVEGPVSKPAFSLDVEVEGKQNSIILKICTAFLLGGESNMAIAEVNLPSGYAIDEDLLNEELKKQPLYRRHETQNMDSKLDVYLESLNGTSTCFQVFANRLFKIAKSAKTFVTVYDYYDLTRKVRTFYQPPSESVCDICIESGDCAVKNCV